MKFPNLKEVTKDLSRNSSIRFFIHPDADLDEIMRLRQIPAIDRSEMRSMGAEAASIADPVIEVDRLALWNYVRVGFDGHQDFYFVGGTAPVSHMIRNLDDWARIHPGAEADEDFQSVRRILEQARRHETGRLVWVYRPFDNGHVGYHEGLELAMLVRSDKRLHEIIEMYERREQGSEKWKAVVRRAEYEYLDELKQLIAGLDTGVAENRELQEAFGELLEALQKYPMGIKSVEIFSWLASTAEYPGFEDHLGKLNPADAGEREFLRRYLSDANVSTSVMARAARRFLNAVLRVPAAAQFFQTYYAELQADVPEMNIRVPKAFSGLSVDSNRSEMRAQGSSEEVRQDVPRGPDKTLMRGLDTQTQKTILIYGGLGSFAERFLRNGFEEIREMTPNVRFIVVDTKDPERNGAWIKQRMTEQIGLPWRGTHESLLQEAYLTVQDFDRKVDWERQTLEMNGQPVKIDGVIAAVPTRSHLEIAQRWAGQGIPVWVEKPTVMSGETEAIRQLAARHPGTVLASDFFLDNDALVWLLRHQDLIDSIGEIKQIHARSVGSSELEKDRAWLMDPNESGGGLGMDMAVHPLAAIAMVSRAQGLNIRDLKLDRVVLGRYISWKNFSAFLRSLWVLVLHFFGNAAGQETYLWMKGYIPNRDGGRVELLVDGGNGIDKPYMGMTLVGEKGRIELKVGVWEYQSYVRIIRDGKTDTYLFKSFGWNCGRTFFDFLLMVYGANHFDGAVLEERLEAATAAVESVAKAYQIATERKQPLQIHPLGRAPAVPEPVLDQSDNILDPTKVSRSEVREPPAGSAEWRGMSWGEFVERAQTDDILPEDEIWIRRKNDQSGIGPVRFSRVGENQDDLAYAEKAYVGPESLSAIAVIPSQDIEGIFVPRLALTRGEIVDSLDDDYHRAFSEAMSRNQVLTVGGSYIYARESLTFLQELITQYQQTAGARGKITHFVLLNPPFAIRNEDLELFNRTGRFSDAFDVGHSRSGLNEGETEEQQNVANASLTVSPLWRRLLKAARDAGVQCSLVRSDDTREQAAAVAAILTVNPNAKVIAYGEEKKIRKQITFISQGGHFDGFFAHVPTLHKFLQNAGYRTYNLLLDQNTWVLEHASDIRQLSHRAGWNGTRSAWIDLANTPLGTLRERSHILTDIYDSFHGAYVFEDRRFGLLQDVFDGCAVIATIPHLEWAWMQRPANGAEAELDPDGFLPFSFRLQANMINFAQGRMSRDDFDRLLGLTGSVRYSLDGGQSWSVRTTDLPVYPDSFRVENITEINDGRVLLDISAKFRPPEAAVNGRILFNIMIQNQAAENIWFTNHPEQNWSLAIKPAARSETRSKIAEWAEKYARRHQDTLSAVPEFEDPPAFLGWFQEHRHLFPSDNHPGKFHGPVYAAQVLSFAGKIPPEKLHNIQRNAAAFQRARKDRKAISGEIRRIWSKPAARWYRTPLARLHYQFDARKLPHRGRQSQTEPVSPSYRHLILTFACGLYGYELIRQIVRKRLRAISPRDYDSFAAWLRATGIGAPEANLESAADWAIEEWFRDRSVPTIPEIESFAAAFGADAAELIRLVFREEKYQAAATANVLTQTFTDSNVEVPPNIRVAVSEALAIFEGSLKKQTRSRKQLESLKIRTKRKEIRALGREVRIPLPELFRDNVAAVSPEGDRLWRRQPFDMMAFVNCENPADYVIAVFIADRTDAANDQVVFLGAGRAVSTIRVPQKRGISQDLIETQAGFLTDLAWRARDEHYRDPENRDAFVIEQFEQGDLFHAIAMPARDRNLGFPDLRRVPMWSPLKGHLWYVGRRGHPLKDAPRALVHVVKTRRGKIRPFRLPDGRLDYLFLLPDRDRIQFYDSLQVNPQSENPDANAQVPLLSIPAQGENFSLSDSPECLTFYLRILARYGNWNVRPVLARQHVVKRKGKRTRKVTKQTKPRVEFTLGKTPGKPGMTFYLDSEYRGILAFLLSRGTAVSNGGIPTWRLYRVGPGQMDDEGHLIDRQGKAVSLEDVQLTPDGKWLDQHQTELDMEAPQLVTEIAPVQGAFHLSMMAQRPSQSVPLYQGTGFSLARVLSGYPLRATSSTVVGVSFRYADQVWERREFQIIELLKSQKSGDSFHVAEGVPSVLHGNEWADKVRGLHYLLTQVLSSPEIKAMGFVFTELARISSVIFRSTAIPGTDDLFRRLGSDLKEISVKIPRGRNRTLVTFVASFLANPTQVPVKLTDDVLRILVETGDE
ncbi:MAG: hypothetical protein PHN49_09470, partial [Candidatus Omnitrophica bacterium]|nr:hypothetical protein [Candidatus Omnitrophota bacterium]